MDAQEKEKLLAVVRYILGALIARRMDEIPAMFRPLLSKFSPESLGAMLEGELTAADWEEIQTLMRG